MRIQNFTPSPGSIGPIQTNYPNQILLVPADVTLTEAYSAISGWDMANVPGAKGNGLGIWLFQAYFDVTAGLSDATVNWEFEFAGAGLNFIEVAQGEFVVAAGVESVVTVGGMFINTGAASPNMSLKMKSNTTDAVVQGGSDPTKNTRIVVVQIGLGASS